VGGWLRDSAVVGNVLRMMLIAQMRVMSTVVDASPAAVLVSQLVRMEPSDTS
jgi:hypothetical protein